MSSLPQHRRLVALRDLTERDHGKTVHVAGLTGTLTGIIAVRDRVQLALIVGGARAWTDLLDGGEGCEVWRG